jgi:divalent metal cation (Fe/Co/Zn/Cd) transporter
VHEFWGQVPLSTPTREQITRRGVRLEHFTIIWNSLEALVSILAGALAGSVALVGFGVDSVIESSSGAVLLWRLRAEPDERRREDAERVALRLVGISFLALTAYVVYESAQQLIRREAPQQTWLGIAIAAVSLVAMPLLARAKRGVAQQLGSGAMEADSRQTLVCAWLSAILLGGLLLNALLGWWWADPAAALCMSPLIAREGVEALRGKTCCGAGPCRAGPGVPSA